MQLSKNFKVVDISTPFACIGMLMAGIAMLVAVRIIAASENAIVGTLVGAVMIIGSFAFEYWIAGAITPRPIDGPGIYYTGALYKDSAGDVTDSPLNAQHLGVNGVLLERNGNARLALVTQCNGQWHAAASHIAPKGWEVLVKCRQNDFRTVRSEN